MKISNPRRILAVSLADAAEHLSQVIRDLTGSLPEPAVVSPPSPPLPTATTTTSSPPAPSSPTLAQPLPPPSAQPPSSTLAGTTHHLPLKTAYYTATVPIWLDLITSPPEWSASFLSAEAKEVLDVLGGVVVVFTLGGANGSARELIKQVGRVVKEGLGGLDWEGVGLAVGVSEEGLVIGEDIDGVLDEWEDWCWEEGLEFVHHRVGGGGGGGGGGEKEEGGAEKERNQFGEKMGIARVLEALQANEWSGGGGGGDSDEDGDEEEFLSGMLSGGDKKTAGGKQGGGVDGEDDDAELDPEDLGFGFDRDDFVGLRKAIWRGGGDGDEEDEEEGDDEVQKLERMMQKLQAVRDRTAGMPEEQRKRIAKQAVDEVMKEL